MLWVVINNFWWLTYIIIIIIGFFYPRTGESRGFAFVRYKYPDEAQKAVDRLDGMIPLSLFGFFMHHVCAFMPP